jgi:hypothetical protein
MTEVTTTTPPAPADERALFLATYVLQICGFTVTK